MSKNKNQELKKRNRVAIILLNMGGPEDLHYVTLFLFKMFCDSKILRIIFPIRYIIAAIIALKRSKKAKEIYAKLGGRSPIHHETELQRQALEKKLREDPLFGMNTDYEVQVFTCMRYSNPRNLQTISEVSSYSASQIILLPLYPQYSTATSLSSVEDFIEKYKSFRNSYGYEKNVVVKTICCYYDNNKVIAAHCELINQTIDKLKEDLGKDTKYRVIFSAHSLPVKFIEEGDPYEWQTNNTIRYITERLKISEEDYKISYQSKVGKAKWLTPSTEDTILEACKDQIAMIVVPISFVSEHVETMIELDLEYKAIADEHKIPFYRVKTPGTNKLFIDGLAELVLNALVKQDVCLTPVIQCPQEYKQCLCREKIMKCDMY